MNNNLLIQTYPLTVILVSMLILVLIVFLMVILFYRRKKDQAYEEVLRLKTFFQSVVNTLPVGIFVKDVSDDFRYIYYNGWVSNFYGEVPGNSVGKNDYETNDPNAAQYRKEDELVLKSDTPLTFERIRYDENNQPCRWALITKTRQLNVDGTYYITAVMVDTTEIRKTEIEVENIQNELSIALDAGSLSVWNYDVEKQRFGSLYKNTVAETGLSFDDAYAIAHPDDKGRYLNFMECFITGVYEKDKEVFRFYRNGKYSYFETHAIALTSPLTGQVYQIIGTEKNITDEIEKKQELEENRLRLEFAFEAADIVAWDYNVENDLFYSHTQRSVFFKKEYDLIKYVNLMSSDDRDKFHTTFLDLINGYEERLDMKVQMKLGGGDRYEWAHLTAKASDRNKDGVAQKIIGTRKYITKEVEAEHKLKADKFKSDLAIKSSGIIQWDYDVEAMIFSSPDPKSFIHNGISRAEYMSYIEPEDVYLLNDNLDEIIAGKKTSGNVQVRLNHPGGVAKWMDIHGVAFEYAKNGMLTRITGLSRDITDVKILTEKIAAQEKAEEMNRLKSSFLANMSHEIRTPLNAIVGFSNLIAQTDNKEEIRDFCKIIENNNELLLQLINDILDFSKMEAGQLDFIYTDVDVSLIFIDLQKIHNFKLKPGVTLKCNLPDESCIIYSEKNRLTQVISNFLTNACKFTSKGFIQMGYEYTENGLLFYVSDTGIGIAQENLPTVFDRFAKFDTFVQGTGLGLSICQTIVHHLNGEIGVSSEQGKGSKFWFTIPCEIKNSSLKQTQTHVIAPEIVVSELIGDRKKRILIAEDNDSNYLLLLKVLGKNYHLIRAVNGEEAITLFNKEYPDVILMDVKMPVMDGLQATREIRKINSYIPIFALTAHAFDEDKNQALKAGCNDFITKPVNVIRLREILDSVLL